MVCNKCGIDKEANEQNFRFRKDAQCLRRTCRDCETARRKEKINELGYYRWLRRERLRARRNRKKKPGVNRRACARWRLKNLPKVRELARAYRARRGREYMKEWRARNKDWYNAYMRDWRRLNALKSEDANGLMDAIAAAIPNGLPSEIKDEVMQEILVKVLAGKIRVSKLRQETKPLITKFYRDYANRAMLSLDAPIAGFEDFTLGETIEG